MSSRVTESAEGWERWGEGGKAEATQSMKALEEAVAALLEEEVALLGNEHPMVGSIGTVDVIQKMVSEGQEIISSPLENDSEGFTSRRRREGTDRVRAIKSFRVRGLGVAAAS